MTILSREALAARVYDLDPPGFYLTNPIKHTPDPVYTADPLGTVIRQRDNFQEWAEFDGVVCSDKFTTHSAVSVKKIASPNIWAFNSEAGIPSDDSAGPGNINLSWNMR